MERLYISSIGENIIESLFSGVLIIDKGQKIVYANSMAPELYRFTDKNHFIGKKFSEVIPSPLKEIIADQFENVIHGNNYRVNKLKFFDQDDNEKYLGASFYPLLDEMKKTIGMIINGKDITRVILESEEKKQLEKMNQELNNLLEKFKQQNSQLNLLNMRNDTVIKTILNSLSSPLTFLINIVDQLERKELFKDSQEEMEHFKGAIKQLINLRDQILEINTFEEISEDLSEFLIEDSLKNVIDQNIERIKKKNLSFELISEEPDVRFFGNSKEIESVFFYILDNAIQYTPENGKITVSTRMWESYFFITVEDSGIGIEPEDLKNIFSPFYRSKKAEQICAGNGLNLTIARNIIEKYNGTIDVESSVENGTKVTYYLKVWKKK